MPFPRPIKHYRITGIPPKSTNNLYRWLKKRYVKTFSYQFFRMAMEEHLNKDPKAAGLLPSAAAAWSDKGLYIEVGIIEEFDLDNTLKGIIDSLQAYYRFNDNQIKGLICRKVPVGNFPLEKTEWDKQYIEIALLQYHNNECHVFDPNELKKVSAGETAVSKQIMDELYKSITGDWSNQNFEKDNTTAVYPTNMYPDIEGVAAFLQVEPKELVELLRSLRGKFNYHETVAARFKKNPADLRKLLNKQYTQKELDQGKKLLKQLR